MHNFSNDGICDVCGKYMNISDSRIEWGYGEDTSIMTYIHICHNDCCNDWNNGPRVGGDIIFNQGLYLNPEHVFKNLEDMMELYTEYESDIKRISEMIFK